MASAPLRIGFVVDGRGVSKYVLDLLRWSQAQQFLTGTHLIVQAAADAAPSGEDGRPAHPAAGLADRLAAFVWTWLLRLERRRLRGTRHADHLQRYGVADLPFERIQVAAQATSTGTAREPDQAALQAARAAGLDLLVHCGPAGLPEDWLEVARLGVISLELADPRSHRGGPPGFWEVYERSAQTGFSVQQWTRDPQVRRVLLRGSFATQAHYLLNQANVCESSLHYLKSQLARIASTRVLQPQPGLPYCGRLRTHPCLREQVAYLGGLAASLLRSKLRLRLLHRQRRWGVAFQRCDWRDLVMGSAHRVANPAGRFFADPFVISRDGADYCFVEDFDYRTQRGRISVLELGPARARLLGSVLEEPFHLSFPFLFEHAGSLFMIPETSENRDIRVYRCVDFPMRWELHRVLMSNVSAVDTMLFRHDGKWWLLTNLAPQAHDDQGAELLIFHADDPFASDWTAHPDNPIYIDPTLARNGGLLADQGQLHRVGQRQGFRQYGAGATIFRIDEITPSRYRETPVARLEPDFRPGLLGTHHMHSNGRVTVFDYKTEETVR